MAVKVIVELKAKPRAPRRVAIAYRAGRHPRSTDRLPRELVLRGPDDPDLLIDIADWESPEERATHLAKAMAAGTYGPVLELRRGPSAPQSSAGCLELLRPLTKP